MATVTSLRHWVFWNKQVFLSSVMLKRLICLRQTKHQGRHSYEVNALNCYEGFLQNHPGKETATHLNTGTASKRSHNRLLTRVSERPCSESIFPSNVLTRNRAVQKRSLIQIRCFINLTLFALFCFRYVFELEHPVYEKKIL